MSRLIAEDAAKAWLETTPGKATLLCIEGDARRVLEHTFVAGWQARDNLDKTKATTPDERS